MYPDYVFPSLYFSKYLPSFLPSQPNHFLSLIRKQEDFYGMNKMDLSNILKKKTLNLTPWTLKKK